MCKKFDFVRQNSDIKQTFKVWAEKSDQPPAGVSFFISSLTFFVQFGKHLKKLLFSQVISAQNGAHGSHSHLTNHIMLLFSSNLPPPVLIK